MKQILLGSLLAAMITLSFTGCQKSAPDTPPEPTEGLTLEQRAKIVAQVRDYYNRHRASHPQGRGNGAVFITPFFATEALGFFKEDPANNIFQLAFFVADLSPRDFYRENPDGTVSVHINNHNTLIYYYPNVLDPNTPELIGTGGRYQANYTGPVLDYGGGYKVIDFENLRAGTITGSGKVGLNGQAPWTSLLMRFISQGGRTAVTEFIVR